MTNKNYFAVIRGACGTGEIIGENRLDRTAMRKANDLLHIKGNHVLSVWKVETKKYVYAGRTRTLPLLTERVGVVVRPI